MRKNIIAMLLVAALSTVFTQSVFAIYNSDDIAAAKAQLNNKEWAIQLSPIGSKGKSEADVISFVDGKMISKNMKTAGFAESEFNVRIGEDGVVIMETMQTDGVGNFVFWRGDIRDGKIRGVFTKEDKRGIISNFSFVGK